MRYTYDFKLKCVEMYQEGRYPETPSGLSTKRFHQMVRLWVRMFEANGTQIFKRSSAQRYTIEQQMEAVAEVMAGNSQKSTAIKMGINRATLSRWLKTFTIDFSDEIIAFNPNVLTEVSKMARDREEKDVVTVTREELKKLNEELIYLRTENAYLKKLRALRMEKSAANLKANTPRT